MTLGSFANLVLAFFSFFQVLRGDSVDSCRIVWQGTTRIEFRKSEVAIMDPMSPNAAKLIKLPADTIWASYRADGIYALVRIDSQNQQTQKPETAYSILKSTGSGPWSLIGTLPSSLMNARAAIPLDDGRFFMIPGAGYFSRNDNTAWSPFAILGKDPNDHWTLIEPVYLDFGLPFIKRVALDGTIDWPIRNNKYSFMLAASIETPELFDRVFEFESGWAYINRHHGIIWIFDRLGTLQKRINLYPDLKEEDLEKPIFTYPMGVLACESAPSGKLLIAGRSEKGFLLSQAVWPILNLALDDRIKTIAQGIEDFPDIQWWEVDALGGASVCIPAPEGAPKRMIFDPNDIYWHFHFLVDMAGEPKFNASIFLAPPIK